MSRLAEDRAAEAGRAGGALVRALARWRRALPLERVPAPTEPPAGPGGSVSLAGPPDLAGAPGPPGLADLARRLDDSGCAYGRVSAARIEHLSRAYERLETKLNAILMAVTGTFLSTLGGLLLYYVRGGSH